MQREEYATEVRRMQKSLRKLRILCRKVLDDNIQAARLKEVLPALRAKNQKLEAPVAVSSICIYTSALPSAQLCISCVCPRTRT